MNRPRDSKGRYIRTSSQKSIKIPTNIYGGHATPTTNSFEKYWKTHVGSSSSWRPKGNLIGGAIEGREMLAGSSKDPIPEGFLEGQPLEALKPPLEKKPNDTNFSLVGDPNFVNFIYPAQVQALFGSSTNTVISQIETSTVELTIFVEPNKDTTDNFSYQRNISPEKERWDTPLSPQKEPPRYTLFKNKIYMER